MFGLCNKNYSQTNQNNLTTKSTNRLSNKVLLDSISNYLLISNSIKNNYYYAADRKLFSNQLIEGGSFNYGQISIDTLRLSFRFNYTGTTGSGGFAPYIQQTFYLQDLSSLYWSEEINEKQILQIISTYDNCKGNFKPIAEFEKSSGCNQSEDKVNDIPDYTRSLFSEYEVVFNKNKLTEETKYKLLDWLNELKSR